MIGLLHVAPDRVLVHRFAIVGFGKFYDLDGSVSQLSYYIHNCKSSAPRVTHPCVRLIFARRATGRRRVRGRKQQI